MTKVYNTYREFKTVCLPIDDKHFIDLDLFVLDKACVFYLFLYLYLYLQDQGEFMHSIRKPLASRRLSSLLGKLCYLLVCGG